ncbi:STAS domain-containing protein [Planomonospora sp. ID67723]|uniref:STAS domain-containing protein n=1 Tax=Planomonospora sp. ID67723 TaxID=2738134 RepID=UPI0027DCCFAC|nr:STAS domain-containing protein [Planomonospora sp. ID67723]
MTFPHGRGRPTLTVSTGLHDEAVTVRAIGELDLAGTPVLRAHLEHVWELPDGIVLIVDLSELTFCDSTGLSELVRTRQRARARGIRLVLAGVGANLARTLAITGLRDGFEIHSDLSAALEAVTDRRERPGMSGSAPHHDPPADRQTPPTRVTAPSRAYMACTGNRSGSAVGRPPPDTGSFEPPPEPASG